MIINKTIDLYILKSMIKSLKRYLIPAIIITLSLGETASAQDRTITLDEAIKLGVANSNVVKLSRSKVDQAVSQYNQAKDGSLPTGKVSFGYNRAEIPANRLEFGK